MSDLISREAALDALSAFVNLDEYYHGRKCENIPMLNVKRYLENAPSAEPERKKGEWIFHLEDLFPEESTQECSVCHEEESIKIQNDNFCPNCGADMRRP